MYLSTLSEFAGGFTGEDVIVAYEHYVAAFSGGNLCVGCMSSAGVCDRSCDLSGVHSGGLGCSGGEVEHSDTTRLVLGSGVSRRCFGSVSGDKCLSCLHESGRGVEELASSTVPTSSSGGDSVERGCDDVRGNININERAATCVVVRGPNYERNKANRVAQKARKQRRKEAVKSERESFFSACDDSVRKDLADSRAARYVAENEAATVRAKLDIEIAQSRDVSAEIRRKQLGVKADIERSMVSIEKTHAVLAATGNVPGDMTGFAATIVGSGSISPNSSVSEAEYRACQKKLLDAEAKLDKCYEAMGLDSLSKQREYFKANDLYTDNTENRDMFDAQEIDYYQDPFIEGKIVPLRTICGY